MQSRDIRTEIRCTPEAFWRCWFDEEFNRAYYLDTIHYRAVKLLEQREEKDRIWRRMEVRPSMGGAPEPLAKLFGDPAWIEEGTWFKAENRMSLVFTPNVLTEKCQIGGEMRCERLGNDRVVRVASMNVHVKVPVVGKLLELSILEEMQAGAKHLGPFTEKFARERGWLDVAATG